MNRLGCGPAPNPAPPNTVMTSRNKTIYNTGEVITYKCSPAFMRLVEGELNVFCQANGQWSPLPVCQSYTYGCKRTEAAREYKGRVNQTRCGNPCQAWGSTSPTRPSADVRRGFQNATMFPEHRDVFDAQNFCRNPDSDENTGPWCYRSTIGENNRRWGYCQVDYCDGRDKMDGYRQFSGACGCDSSWFNRINNFGNIRVMESTTLQECREFCDNHPECEGVVFDDTMNKCWAKKCSCEADEVVCDDYKHETYYKKITPECPGAIYIDRWNRKHCFFSLFNFNLSTIYTYDFNTSRRLCNMMFPLKSDIATFETEDEWNGLLSKFNFLRIPKSYPTAWVGLSRPRNTTLAWAWTSQTQRFVADQLPFSRWASRQPSSGYEEQCAQVIMTPKGRQLQTDIGHWDDVSCHFKAPVICEAKMPNFV